MGFKINTSFLRFLTMGAIGVRSTMEYLREEGFEPIELERYSSSNKIWMTKVKRLRLPDILCARTGLRVEVRAKSDLKVRMSDAPNNPERRWDAGLHDDDAVAFVACDSAGGLVEVKGDPAFFLVGDLRATVHTTKQGSRKSGSEGAELDREWKTTVPSQDGEVLEVTRDKVVARLASGRRQSYPLRGKTPYVQPGDKLLGGATILSGVVPRLAPLDTARSRTWEPMETLAAPGAVDRYAAAKAIPERHVATAQARTRLVAGMNEELDDRVALEMAASAVRLGAEEGLEHIVATLSEHSREDLRMEAVLILTELGTSDAATELKRIAMSDELRGGELRQAATWGLGKAGCRVFGELLDLLGDEEDAVALHAIVAFDSETPDDVVRALVDLVRYGGARSRAAASQALQLIGSEVVVRRLIDAARSREGARPWILATLGKLDPAPVRAALAGDRLLAEVEPLLALGPSENWLARAEAAEDLRFLLQQDIA